MTNHTNMNEKLFAAIILAAIYETYGTTNATFSQTLVDAIMTAKHSEIKDTVAQWKAYLFEENGETPRHALACVIVNRKDISVDEWDDMVNAYSLRTYNSLVALAAQAL